MRDSMPFVTVFRPAGDLLTMYFVWIGIGGALGSIARAWMAIAVADITGPRFPWGTILINIFGSFVIGLFGTLTATDGRFSVSADTRAFVMIGICGGFTTFSSFSLQTLDLIRDGRAGQAMANILLSVILCLVAVTAGFWIANSLRVEHRHAAAGRAIGPTRTALVVLNDPLCANAALDAGTCLLELTGTSGRLAALAVRMPPSATLMPSEEVMTDSREEAIRAEQQRWPDQLRGIVASWRKFTAKNPVNTEWLDEEGDIAEVVQDLGRRSDVVVITLPGRHESDRMHTAMHAALFDTGAPVLVVPPGFTGLLGKKIAIAWKPNGPASRAIEAAMPLLRGAEDVYVLCAVRPPEMPAILTEQGIAARVVAVPDGPGSVGERLLKAAADVMADALVLGAFAHGEWRERLFGGVTRVVLAQAKIPLLMKH